MIELLSPVGDFDCLKAAVQNGANAVYFGAKNFGARAFASNFDNESLEKAINYAKLRNVKTNLTLNTLIKPNEFEDALNLAKTAYCLGIDAIIVQDLGLATKLIKLFPDLDIHASTQMTVHNLEGVLELQKLGFKRVVLSRELSLKEIEYIVKNSNIEIETFIHGALCISYSGECLFSSMVGGRSGNRGKCAQPCRLPYELIQENKSLDNGYLISPRDLCSLEYLPKLIDAGVTSFKIEGRMKSPEYVATVTRIYRKYIDIILSSSHDTNKKFIIEENDKKDLMQVFNRGGFSSGHLSSTPNKNLIFKEKQNNMGLFLGTIQKYNKNKGLVTCNLKENLSIGDSISFENENTKYKISELMEKNVNIKNSNPGQIVTFGRMKGNIKPNDKIYKISDKKLSTLALESYSKENIKIELDCKINLKKNSKISVHISCIKFNKNIDYVYEYIPNQAKNAPLTKEKIINQFNKILDTPFVFKNIEINLDNDLFIPISILNDIRRVGIEKIENKIIQSFKRVPKNLLEQKGNNLKKQSSLQKTNISLLLNNLDLNFDYSKLENVDKLYIPLIYFNENNYTQILNYFSKNYNLYIYMPVVIRKDFIDISKSILKDAIEEFNIKGIVFSSISQLEILRNSPLKNLEIIGNYTLNIFNTFSAETFNKLGFNSITLSPELDKDTILNLCKNLNILKEFIVFGKIPIMTMNYCPLGKSNKCYDKCKKLCKSSSKFYLKDRMGFLFRIIPSNFGTISTIYNSKTTSIEYKDFNINTARIDILDEDIQEINNIINTVNSGKRFEGKNYTNGNLNREI